MENDSEATEAAGTAFSEDNPPPVETAATKAGSADKAEQKQVEVPTEEPVEPSDEGKRPPEGVSVDQDGETSISAVGEVNDGAQKVEEAVSAPEQKAPETILGKEDGAGQPAFEEGDAITGKVAEVTEAETKDDRMDSSDMEVEGPTAVADEKATEMNNETTGKSSETVEVAEAEAEIDMDVEKDTEETEQTSSNDKTISKAISIEDDDEDKQSASDEQKKDIQKDDVKDEEGDSTEPMDIVEEEKDDKSSEKGQPEQNTTEEKPEKEIIETSESVQRREDSVDEKKGVAEEKPVEKEEGSSNLDVESKEKGATDDEKSATANECKEQEKSEQEESSDKDQRKSEQEESSSREEPLEKKLRLSIGEKEETEDSKDDKIEKMTETEHKKLSEVSEEKPTEKANVKETDDVVMVESEAKPSETAQSNAEKPKEVTEEPLNKDNKSEEAGEQPLKEHNDDVMVVEPDDLPKGSTKDSTADKDASGSKDDTDKVTVVEPQETTAANDSAAEEKSKETNERPLKEVDEPKNAVKTPLKEDKDDAMVVEPNDLPKESTADEIKTHDSTAGKDASASSSKDDTDDVMVVEPQESKATGDSTTEEKPKEVTDKQLKEDNESKGSPKKPLKEDNDDVMVIESDEPSKESTTNQTKTTATGDSATEEKPKDVTEEPFKKDNEPIDAAKTPLKKDTETKDASKTPLKEDNEDIMLVESDDLPKQSTTEKLKTDSPTADKDVSATSSKDDTDEVMVVEPEETTATGDSVTEEKSKQVKAPPAKEVNEPKEAAKTSLKEDNDDVMVVESDDPPKESTTEKLKTDVSTAGKDASTGSSKDDTDDVMVVEPQESTATGDSTTEEKPKEVTEEPLKKDNESKESSEEPLNKGNESKKSSEKPLKEDNDDVMVIETDEPSKESTTKQAKTDVSTADKDASAAFSKNDADEVMVVEPEKSTAPGDSKTEDKKVDSSGNNKESVEDKPTENAGKSKESSDKQSEKDSQTSADSDKPASTTKRFVLDEKSGMFEEKETAAEESVPQVFGDSDEDVVMVDNYITTDRKSASKPVPQSPKPAAAAAATTATEQKSTAAEPTAQKKEVAKPKSSSIAVECINIECKKQTRETTPAPAFVLNFFGMPKKTKKQRICLNCYDEVVEKYGVLGGAVLDHQPLLFCEMPQKNELVEISDSSEEEEEEDVKQESEKPLPSDVIALVESELNDILTSTFEKINLNQQIDWTEQIMKQKIAYNTKLSDEINNELNELQRKVDRIHLQLYSKSRPRIQDLPPCNIFEVDPQARHALVQQTTTPSRFTTPRSVQQPQQKQIAPMPAAQTTAPMTSIPVAQPKEEFSRPAVNVGQFYFAVKHKLLSNWAECQVVEAVSVADKALYKVNFLYNQGAGAAPIKVVPAKYLAYRHSFNVKLPLGTRVIARFDAGTTIPASKQSQQAKNSSFYPGIIAESFGKYNRNRYLIFFDDGYAQYVTHGDVRVVCEESKEVWTDIHPHSQEFIKNYLMNYRSQRPMVQVKVGQRIITEWKGKWIYAKVIDIDASLVQLHFADDNRYEWIYRGSTRLGPLYQEKALSMSKANNKFSKFQKRNEPSIEYITLDDDDEDDQNKQQQDGTKSSDTSQDQALQNFKNLQLSQADSANRSVAKKSTFHRAAPASQPSAVFMNSSTIYCEDDRPKGKIVYYTAKKHLPPLKYKPHECNPSCLFKITHNLKSYSPMAKPLLSGWERQLCKMKYKKVFVVYRAPCGRRVRNMYELHMYLRMTKATLNVENFDFDPMIHCLAEYVIENHIYHNPDLSDGREFMAVPCVNYFDDTKPPPCIYSTERIPTEGVNLNLDSDFLCGCDCEDDCIDKSRCQCWQLTIAGAKFGNPSTPIDNIGYVYKRLQEAVVTGIYECNAKCKCKSNCLNRVVQHPLMTKLQVFKTSNRGWGIRCLNDVAKGSFICIYSGHLLTEEAGNNICQANENKAGDEYFADLDYIETVEQLKEGYEEDVVESESEVESDYDARQDSAASDEDFTSSTNPSDAAVKTRSQARRDSRQKNENKSEKKNVKKKEDTKTGSDDEREMVNLMPVSDMTKGDAPSPVIKYRSVRKFFGKHESIYIMDAKKSGNLGRYFNHSCNPNLFVQNVFVDTHDLRFPWVAFFALCNVRAGSELTWNYNYDVGSVPGKVLYCQCGAENCRQRLL